MGIGEGSVCTRVAICHTHSGKASAYFISLQSISAKFWRAGHTDAVSVGTAGDLELLCVSHIHHLSGFFCFCFS